MHNLPAPHEFVWSAINWTDKKCFKMPVSLVPTNLAPRFNGDNETIVKPMVVNKGCFSSMHALIFASI